MSQAGGAEIHRAALRRELASALGACLAGSAVVLLAGGAPWARVGFSMTDGFPVVDDEISGRTAAPLAVALGLLGLAGAIALLATRGRSRRTLGGLLAVAGALVMIDAVRALARLPDLAAGAAPAGMVGSADATGWPWVVVTGGAAIAAAGLLTLVRGGRWRAMSERYEAPGATRTAAATSSAATPEDPEAAWRALDRGEDPTVPG